MVGQSEVLALKKYVEQNEISGLFDDAYVIDMGASEHVSGTEIRFVLNGKNGHDDREITFDADSNEITNEH